MSTTVSKIIENQFADFKMSKENPKYKNATSRLQIIYRKDDDIILTASPELTIKEIASRLGIKNIVCSKVDYETGEITRLCMRQNKITALIEDFGEDLEIDDFYTDSLKNDGFFAKKAKRVFVVKGTKIRPIEI